MLFIRVLSCLVCGITAGFIVKMACKGSIFNFNNFEEKKNKDTDPNIFIRLLKNIQRNINATWLYFLIGIILSVLFQRYVPSESFATLFGKHQAFGILMAATIGVPLYACGGGTIPLIISWMENGMAIGVVTAFMITGSATKITNLGALKIVLGIKNFVAYLVFVVIFALFVGFVSDIFI